MAIIIKNKIILIYNIIIKKRSINNKYLLIKKIKYIMNNNIELIHINLKKYNFIIYNKKTNK